MKITIAMDSFKGSMTSLEAGKAVENGIRAVYADDNEIVVVPVADGGEGTVEALTYKKDFVMQKAIVTGPLGEKVEAAYIIADRETAIIEMSAAAGLTLVPEDARNPMYTTTYGVGQMINHALKQGCKHFIIGIGGSATNDCGIGMLQALGFDILNNDLKNVEYGAKGLKNVRTISAENVSPKLWKCDFTIACDVDNPLVGERGCSKIFSPQKGATPDMAEHMDEWMEHFADIVEAHFQDNYVDDKQSDGKNNKNLIEGPDKEAIRIINHQQSYNRYTPGAGAAGGMGYAFLMFLNAKLMSGADIVISQTGLENYIKKSDLVIVGEGKLDAQSTMGKIPVAIANLAKKHGKKVIAIAGIVEDKEIIEKSGAFDEIYCIDRQGMNLENAMKKENSMNNLKNTAEKIFKSYHENYRNKS